MANKKGLGRGIDALFEDIQESSVEKNQDKIQNIPLDEIRPNPHQPRHNFDQKAIEELAESIKQSGVLQPIVLRASKISGYEIVAGERRVRASKIAGQSTIPAIVRQLSEEEMIEMAVLENLQREDLTALEEAEAYAMMMEKLDLTQSQVAERLGKSRPHVANSLRLLKLPDQVKQMLKQKQISMGIARTLLALKDQDKIIKFAKRAINEDMTVRALEKAVAHSNQENKRKKVKKRPPKKPNYIRVSEEQLMEKYGTAVQIQAKQSGRGKIQIDFNSQQDLGRILDIMDVSID